ncbi:MAG: Glycosyl transferase family protein [Parcubacteria group bacterium GW2011_GWA2_46_9]|nr:MAG: Glycosyl transferase family protein [Parcubacteria group bacterium GW2011_GWA2_46_9]
MKIAVQLVTWNGQLFLADCLSSLSNQTFQDWQIFIIDNNSTDRTPNIIHRWLDHHIAQYSFKTLPLNVGFAPGHNLLLQSHDAPYVFILNQDVLLEPNYLYELICCLEARRQSGSATGCLFRWESRHGQLIKTDILDSTGLEIYRTHRVVERGRGEDSLLSDDVEEVFGVPATAALYRRVALDETVLHTVNGREWFDNDFGSYKEDVDLAYRLQLRLGQSTVI